MKILFVLLMFVWTFPAAADRRGDDMSLAEQLGTAAGLAYACDAGKSLDDYELISARLLANKASTDAAEKEAYRSYAAAKIRALKMHQERAEMSCAEILKRFKSMKIFKFVVYADGTVKMDDGTTLRPQRPIKNAPKKKK